ncbi:MAG: NACHT domain-containing protein, partial [Planctomycetes bacterium]|nr:NACHT domain-containing protein [Planctomycetota bacterium]
AKSAVDRYRKWLVAECGYIQLDGLPADADLSAFRMRLERLFVPLKVISKTHQPDDDEARSPEEIKSIAPVGAFLDRYPRFSLLAKPGGGKSTLLKRLAVAYAEPDRLRESDDGLPERDWLPLFLRCRILRDRAHRPIRELLDDLPQHAGMSGDEASVFRGQIDEALRSGRALLLVDGLDEISDEGTRTTFAGHLRTFLAMFPQVAMVVTSREAGYRHVAGVVASACKQASLAPFDERDVERLCESWHVQVVGDNETVRSEARELADTIWQNERIRSLAENPLMLTTLLVVRRCCGGELPTRRVELYWEAARVLIRTWNTAGFEPMDLEETLAQLSYVACAMMNEGVQRVGHRLLLELLQEARGELQAELQFAAISPAQFIERIEYRSSLLMQTGHERIDDELQPVYEFRHLTFQEYLAARGLVEEQYPGRDKGQSLAELLEPHFEDELWREVIPLAAVLAGRKAEPLIKCLTAVRQEFIGSVGNDSHEILLRQCLLDEVQVTPPTLRSALRQMARCGDEEFKRGSIVNLRRGKSGEVFQEVAEEAYFGAGPGWDEYMGAIRDLVLEAVFQDRSPQLSDHVAQALARSLSSGERNEQARAALVCMKSVHSYRDVADEHYNSLAERFRPLRDAIGHLLLPDDPPLALAAAWALVWAGARRLPRTRPEPGVIGALFGLWREADSSKLRTFAAWAFSTQPLLPRGTFAPEVWGNCDAWIEQEASRKYHESSAALVLAWYRRCSWSDSELAAKLSKSHRHPSSDPTAREMLTTLGEAGRRVLEEWDAEVKEQ